ncbi:MAG: T9SS type A sorting domain-containing protein [Bacteroidia bacterium]|nr:T9SS type A sorting domain-containing protein [Bacteroidia bacterium]
MKQILILLAFTNLIFQSSAQTSITVMDNIIFYDGYAAIVTTPPPPAGVLQHRNDLFARKLSSSELASIGTTLQMDVMLYALCDNYDRIGSVNMALVPAGSSTYHPDSVQRIELGRFITPFMNKNIQPDSVPYSFNIDNVAMLLKDTIITNSYDIWIELQVFGVPYAAQTQVAGCSGRNDVFRGRLRFETNASATPQNNNVLIPLFFNQSFNNYQVGATDVLGITQKTLVFNVPEDLTDVSLYLITSNHGANTGGEEYNRRAHYAYLNNFLRLSYTPGRTTCEPFRQYNTQGNGIYGATPRTDAQWQSFSNWCPGDVIDIRIMNIGSLSAGNHTFFIRVPAAVFANGEGNFPMSLYLQGKNNGIASGISDQIDETASVSVYPNPSSGEFTLEQEIENAEIVISNIFGKEVLKTQATSTTTNFQIDEAGVYLLQVKTNKGIHTRKIVVNR